jgi:hypothetical protein
MGAAILVTLGVLFLIDNYAGILFRDTFPVLLLVIGGVLLISRTGSTDGHVQPGWIQASTAPPAQEPWTTGVTPPPPPSQQLPSGADNPPSSPGPNDSQVKP